MGYNLEGESSMSESFQSMSHSKWDCKYHLVFVPKRRRKAVFGNIGKHLGAVLHELARQKECRIIEGHLLPDHVHMCISIPPQHSVSSVIGFRTGKSAIAIARQFGGRERNAHGRTFLGTWLLCFNSRLRRRAGSPLHSRAGCK